MQPLQCDSSYKNAHLYLCRRGNEPYHEKLPSRYHDWVHAALFLPLPARLCGVQALHLRLLPHYAAAAFSVMGHHSWWMLLWKLSYPKSMSAQKEDAGMHLNKHTCIFLAIEATVNNLAKYMDECLYPFKYHHQATRDTNVFAAVVCFFCMCFIREIMSLD